MPLHEFTSGLQLGYGIQPVNPVPVDSYSGPYVAGSTTAAVSLANSTIPAALRFLSMEVRILVPDPNNAGQTLAYKYWYRGSTANSGLVEFSSGGIVGDYVSTFNGLTGAVSGVTTSVANTFTALQTFNSGISAAGSTFSGIVNFTQGLSAANGITFGSDISVYGVVVGRGAGSKTNNTAVGSLALAGNTSGTGGANNTAIGRSALQSNNNGNNNTAVGWSALVGNTSGGSNTAVGRSALSTNTGNNNTAVGMFALAGISGSSSNNNVAVGFDAGRFFGTAASTLNVATSGTFIGYQARASADGQTNEIVIGTDAVGLGSNTAVIGATTQISATIYGIINAVGGISAAGATLSGIVTAPTPVAGTNNTQVATTEFVQSALAAGGGTTGPTGPAGATGLGFQTLLSGTTIATPGFGTGITLNISNVDLAQTAYSVGQYVHIVNSQDDLSPTVGRRWISGYITGIAGNSLGVFRDSASAASWVSGNSWRINLSGRNGREHAGMVSYSEVPTTISRTDDFNFLITGISLSNTAYYYGNYVSVVDINQDVYIDGTVTNINYDANTIEIQLLADPVGEIQTNAELELQNAEQTWFINLAGAPGTIAEPVGTSGIVVSKIATASGTTYEFSNTGVLSFNGLTGHVSGVNTVNGATGSITNVAKTDISNIFSATQNFSGGISASGGTFGSLHISENVYITGSLNILGTLSVDGLIITKTGFSGFTLNPDLETVEGVLLDGGEF